MSGDLAPNHRQTFRYALDNNTRSMTGILCSNNTQLSVSFFNGADVEINSLESMLTDSLALPPNKRILTFKQDLTTCRLIMGSITNISKENQKVSLYFLTH